MRKVGLEELQVYFFQSMAMGKSHQSLLDLIEPAGTLESPLHAMQIYQDAYKYRAREAMGETYDGVWSCLGDEAFFLLVDTYIFRHPSYTHNIMDLANDFPNFLHKETDIEDEIPFLKDLANFELLFQKTFHAPKDQRKSSGSNNTCVNLELPSSLQLYDSHFDLKNLWNHRSHPEQASSKFHDEPLCFSFFRDEQGEVQIHKWNKWQGHLLKNLKIGMHLEDAFIGMEKLSETDVSNFFSFISQIGLIKTS